MKKVYESTKNAAKKYTGIALAVSALALPAYANSGTFPVEAETRAKIELSQKQEYQKKAQDYTNEINNARSLFNKAIEDRKLTNKEQTGLYESLNAIKRTYGSWPKEFDELAYGVHRNLCSFDMGTPALEEKLKEQGLEVKVEGNAGPEISLFFLSLAGLWAGSLIAGELKRFRRNSI